MMWFIADYDHGGNKRAAFLHVRRGWIVALVAAASMMVSQHARSAQTYDPEAQYKFDIPSQPLMTSLKAVSAITKLELYYESSLIEGQRSPPVSGLLSPDAALRRLLEGTGLSLASFEAGTITLLPTRQPLKGQDIAALKSRAAEFNPYFALVQASLRAALCQERAIQTDQAELIVRLWIAPSGSVARADILSPTGSGERDRVYASALRNIVIGQAPPQAMPQPVTLMVLPRTSRMAAECQQLGDENPARARANE